MQFKGEKTELVTLKHKTETQDAGGQMVPSWDGDDKPVYAEFFSRHGKEGETDGQILVIQDVRCKMRYREELDPNIDGNRPEADYRIQRGATTYDIQSVMMEGRRDALLLMLKRRDNTS